MKAEKKKIFYGWYVAVTGCLVMAMTVGLTNNSFGQFVKPVCEDMGFTRQQMSLNATILSLVSLGFALIWGTLSKKIRLHRWMCVSAVLLPVLFFSYSFANSPLAFYGISVAMGLSYCFVSMMIFTTISGNWFEKHRGMAIGITSMGSGIGGMVMNPLAGSLIQSVGWRSTYQLLAVAMAVLIIPAIWFVVREKPADKGLLPYGSEEKKSSAPAAAGTASEASGISCGEAVKKSVFWILATVTILMVITTSSFSPTLPPHLSDNGYSVDFAALLASLSMGALAVGKVILGRLFDQLGVRKASVIACIFTLAAALGMVFCTQKISLAAIVLGIGLGGSFGAICVPIILRALFGSKDFDSIYGKLFAAIGLGSAVSPVISGRVYDLLGSYVPFFLVAATGIAVSIAVLWKVLPKEEKGEIHG